MVHWRSRSGSLRLIAIASTPTLLNMPIMAIPAAIYALIMFVTSAIFGWLLRKQSEKLIEST